ncbi:hypothetical protein [Croceimicrobium sp.]|uniref:hypothetical protein n=1 Tax=Croceimicrobium sp. TaxID=2828340 RepID=UPI003BA88182
MFRKSKTQLFQHLGEPPNPWGNRIVIGAAGIIAGGWTHDNKIFLLSSDAYSISNPETGEKEIQNWDENEQNRYKFSKDNLEYRIDELNQTIKVFGLRGGNGNHLSSDYWNLDSFHPSLGEQIIGLRHPKSADQFSEYWKNFQLIRLERLEYSTLTYGFSPNERHFAIFGSAGAEIFSR